ncbi:hypothetical protein LTR15_006703 [Elasticomyces elasticus]|nr:hypothetical protein LTR15_006703 [Elasticomyces elasticus]
MSRYNYPSAKSASNSKSANYYDPVGSQPSQPTGYTYGSTASGTTSYSTAPNSAAYQGYGSSYNSHQQTQQQQYGTSAPAATSSTSRTNATGSMNGQGQAQEYAQQATNAAAGGSNTYDSSSWAAAGYGSSGASQTNRTQSSTSPLYATQATAGTFGNLSLPDQSRTQTTGYTPQGYQAPRQTSAAPSSATYPAYASQTSTAQQPQRYNSPAQAQSNQTRQPARGAAGHQPSPRVAAVHQSNRQQSASAEPPATTMTVNPSQVYDDRAERQRKAQIEAEKRRKREEEQAAQKTEEDRIAAEKAKVQAEEDAAKAAEEAAAKKAENDRKSEQRKKAREEKRQSKTAAATLQKMASAGGLGASLSGGDEEGPPLNAEEAEMRAMFKKMREFNAKNPTMLAKLWEEERSTHSTVGSLSQPAKAAPAAPVATSKVPAASSAKTGQFKPFQKPAAAKAAPKAPTASASTSLWPPQKKGSLAEAAAKWLAGLPENAGKTVAKDEVFKILEANPSYVQLCEALEGLGLKFERSALARELLKAVPDGMKGGQPAASPSLPNGSAPKTRGTPSDTPKKKIGRPKKVPEPPVPTTVDYEAPRFTSLADAAREIYRKPSMSMPMGGPVRAPPAMMQATPATHAPPPMNDYRPPSIPSQPPAQSPIEVKPELKLEEPRRPPANKEEAARKRTFGDLVDLTADMSDDEPPPKKMVFQMGTGQTNGLSQPNGPPQQPQTNGANAGIFKPMNAADFYKRPAALPGATPGLGGLHVAAPWQPKTVPSNVHVPNQNAQARPQPPVLPAPPPPKPKGPSLEVKQIERVKGKMLVEPIMRDRVARKSKYDPRTVARDVLLATGRHPDMRALNAHLSTMAKLLGDHGGSFEIDGQRGNRSDLSTIRWDIIDVAQPAKAKAEEAKTKPIALLSIEETADADDEDDDPTPMETVRQTVDNGDGTMGVVVSQQPLGLNGKVKKKRGRKPRHTIDTIETVSFADGTGNPRRITIGGDGATPTQRAPAQGTPATGEAIGYSQFRQIDADGNVIKKKGRPFGWRKSVHSREAQGLTPPKPGAPRGPKKAGPSGEKPLVEPEYQVWECKWRNCGSELHNLETLKKHVVKLHGKGNERREFECLWEGCEGVPEAAGSGKGKAKASDNSVATFPDLARWLEHVNKAHLVPVAWKFGDGPRGGTASDYNGHTDSEAYLSDAQGRAVTPIIRPAADREATSRVVPAALRKPGVASMKDVGFLSKDAKEALEELECLENHKKAVGVTMERTGAVFANKKRRQGFLDDEDFEDEVESEGVHWEGED